jgi:hypothetical protein
MKPRAFEQYRILVDLDRMPDRRTELPCGAQLVPEPIRRART